MKTFFNELFDYTHHLNEKLADHLTEIGDDVPEKIIPLFSHMMNAHQIWNARIMGTQQVPVHLVYAPKVCKALSIQNYKDTIKILEKAPMGHVIKYENTKGEMFESNVQHIMYHVVNHTTHHRAQIMAALRDSGLDTMSTDYIFFKRKAI